MQLFIIVLHQDGDVWGPRLAGPDAPPQEAEAAQWLLLRYIDVAVDMNVSFTAVLEDTSEHRKLFTVKSISVFTLSPGAAFRMSYGPEKYREILKSVVKHVEC